MVQRWRFIDGLDTYTVPINPNEMTSPFPEKNIQVQTTVSSNGQPVVYEGATKPTQWQFSGVILGEQHLTDLLAWSQKKRRIVINDHFGRSLDVYITAFKPTPKRSSRYWKHEYTVNALVFSISAPTVHNYA